MATLPNGIGETLGDQLVTGKPLFTTGSVIFVLSTTGDDLNTGLNKAQPKATLAGAQTAATNGDIIVLLDGHTESYSAALTLSKNLTIVGSGSASGVPTVNFRKGSAYGGAIFTITAAGLQLRNIKIRESAASDNVDRVSVQANGVSIIGCYFESGDNDPTASAVQVNNAVTNLTVKSTTFISTSDGDDLPGPGLLLTGTSTDFRYEGVIFDGGTVGFLNGLAYTEGGAPTRRFAEQISMLRGADASLHASAAQSYWQPTTTSGDVRS